MTDFFEIFQPGLKYLREERDRQKMLVSKPTHGGGAPLGIDLDGGTAKISIKPRAADSQEPDPTDDEASVQPAVSEADTEPDQAKTA